MCRLVPILALLAVAFSACSGGEETSRGMQGTATEDRMAGDAMDGEMGGLGGTAETIVLAETTLEQPPAPPLAWSGFEVSSTTHAHAAAFVHAQEATSLSIDGDERALDAGDAAYVPAGTVHTHGAGSGWDVLLAHPDVDPPTGAAPDAVFRSDPLEGVPRGPARLRFLLVELPPGAETSVHTHPGPEYIYATRGTFVYENAVIGERVTDAGDDHSLPAATPVQKRNPDGDATAAFLSWFVVPSDEPFSTGADFSS